MASTATSVAGGGSNGRSAYENVQVVVRMRPLNEKEAKEKDVVIVKCEGKDKIVVNKEVKTDTTGIILGSQTLNKTKEWTLDRVFDEKSTQEDIYKTVVDPVVSEVLNGYSCTVFAYGQTGTGKTFTMEGCKDASGALIEAQKGIIARAVDGVFAHLARAYSKEAPMLTQAQAAAAGAGKMGPQLGEWAVKISYLEIYNERLDDLLSYGPPTTFERASGGTGAGGAGAALSAAGGPSGGFNATGAANAVSAGLEGGGEGGGGPSGPVELKIVEAGPGGSGKEREGAGGSVRVAGLEEFHVSSAEECFAHLKRGSLKRATAETAMNKVSSRSHCVFTLTITMKELFDGSDCYKVGRLNLVDLAGSESVGRSGATDKRAREAGSINTSLLTLGRVITALVEKQPHVPYRDSKLTRLLQDSLGGRTKTVMIATVSPALANAEETISTLEYASRAKRIQNRPEAISKMEKKELTQAHMRQLEELRARLRAQLDKADGYEKVKVEELERLKGLEASLAETEARAAEEVARVQGELATVRGELAARTQELEAARAAHAATCARLGEVEAQLAAVRAELEALARAHEDAQAVIRGQAAVEAALSGQAQRTGESLRAAAGDVQGLHAKVGRVRSTLAANRSVADGYGTGAAARLAALCGEAQAWSGQQSAAAQELQAGAQTFAQESAVELAGLLAQLAKVKGDACAYAKGVVAASAAAVEGEVAGAAAAGLQAVAGAQGKAAAEAVGQAEVMAAHLARIAAALEAQAAQLSAWHAGSTAALSSLSSSVSNFAQGTHTSLAALQQAVAAQAAALDAQLAQQAAALTEAQARADAGTEAAAAALLAQVTASLASFTAGRREEGAALTAGLLAGAGKARDAVAGMRGEVQGGLSALDGRVSQWGRESAGQLAAAAASADEQLQGCVGAVQEGRAGVLAGQASVPAAAAAHTAAASAAAGAAQAALEGVRATVAAHSSRAKSGAVSYADSASRACEALAAAAQAGAGRSRAFAECTVAVCGEVSASAGRAAEGVQGWAQAEGAALHALLSHSLQPEPVTGSTPGKRDYPLPAALLASSPPAHVAKRFRAAREGGASTPAADTLAWGRKVQQDALPPYVPCVPPPPAAPAPAAVGGEQAGPLVRVDSAGAQALATFSARLLSAQAHPPTSMPAAAGTAAGAAAGGREEATLLMQHAEGEGGEGEGMCTEWEGQGAAGAGEVLVAGRLSTGSAASSASSLSAAQPCVEAEGSPPAEAPQAPAASAAAPAPAAVPAPPPPAPPTAAAAPAAVPAPAAKAPASAPAPAAAGRRGAAAAGPTAAPTAAPAPAGAGVGVGVGAAKGGRREAATGGGSSENAAPAGSGKAGGSGAKGAVATVAGSTLTSTSRAGGGGAGGGGGGAVTGARKVAGPGAARAKGAPPAADSSGL